MLRLFDELIDERRGLEFLSRLFVEQARLLVHQIVRQDLGRGVHDLLEIARGHRLARFGHWIGGELLRERVDIDRRVRIAGLLHEFFGRLELRVHPQDESAPLHDLIGAPLFEERQSLLKSRDNSFFDCIG